MIGIAIEHIDISGAFGMVKASFEVAKQVIDQYLFRWHTIDKQFIVHLIHDNISEMNVFFGTFTFLFIFLNAWPVFRSKTKISPSLLQFLMNMNLLPMAITTPWVTNSSFVSNRNVLHIHKVLKNQIFFMKTLSHINSYQVVCVCFRASKNPTDIIRIMVIIANPFFILLLFNYNWF